MKITISIKDPDSVFESISDTVRESLDEMGGLSSEEKDRLSETRVNEMFDILSRWIQYGEYIRIEFDTEAGTAKVLENE